MLGGAYAAVPLYKLFCQKTGFAGTPKRAAIPAQSRVTSQTIRVRFDANVNKNLPWRFGPETPLITLPLGQVIQLSYRAENLSDHFTTGTATFNVTPEAAAPFFNKVQCFCFTEQHLKPGEVAHLPVTLFVDPDIAQDPQAQSISEITLSYTFYQAVPKNETDSEKTKTAAIKPIAENIVTR